MTLRLALVASALVLAACSSSDGPSLPRASELPLDAWTEIQPGGATTCARGTPYSFWVRPGTTNRVIVDFIGGGACWNHFTCSIADALFTDDVAQLRAAIDAGTFRGLYDHANEENPFRDYWHVVVPYCTGDIHWGDATATYTAEGEDDVTIHHRGAVNARAVLGWVYESFPDPEQVFVTGCSAGSYGSVLWSADVMRHYPDTRVIQFGDSGAGIITESFFRDSFPSWHALEAFPTWIPALDPATNDIFTMDLADLYVGIAQANPDDWMSQYASAYDTDQVFYFTAMGGSSAAEWHDRMNASLDDIEGRAENFSSFRPSGDQHCIVLFDNFYTVNVDGRRLVDWLRDLEQASSGAGDSVACSGEACRAPTP